MKMGEDGGAKGPWGWMVVGCAKMVSGDGGNK